MTSPLGKRLVTLVISVAYFAVREICRAVVRYAFFRPAPSPLVVLTYHAVAEADARRFEEQMRVLKTMATPVFADETLDGDGRRRAVVTFDDGFQSVFDEALPIMARHGVPATLFVPTGYLADAPGWIPAARRQAGASGILASAATLASSDRRLVKVGSHTVTHPHLTSLHERALHVELAASKRALEEITCGAITMLSFPYGSYDTRVLEAARAVGYGRLFANVPVRLGRRHGPRLVGRINVSPRDWRLEFRLKVQGAYDWMALAVPAKHAMASVFWKESQA